MKDTTKVSRIAGQLEKMYRSLNEDFFDGALSMPVITVQSTPHAYGHVTCGKIWEKVGGGECRYELNIGAGTLFRPIEETTATLLHEMVHIYHLERDVQDCSRGGRYHNKIFKAKAESVGLVIEYDKNIGWSITSPSDDLVLYVADKGWQDFCIFRNELSQFLGGFGGSSGASGTTGNKPSSTRKYQCPCCGNSVRATKDVNIICGDCDVQMIKVR